jgi:outer membrane murein-binding lipoprotein Lpp
MIELVAAVVGASIGVAGLSATGFSKRNNDSREAVIRLTMAVESIAGKLEELHQDMKSDRKEIYSKLSNHDHRLTLLESRDS